MITIVSATNRPDSMTYTLALAYQKIVEESGQAHQLFDLKELPEHFAGPQLYTDEDGPLHTLIQKYIIQSERLVFIIPEYQGSYPGVLKCLLDGIAPRYLKGKKAAIIGVSDGRAGNLRGQDHLTGVLHYLKVHVHYNKPKLSQINTIIATDGQWLQPQMETAMRQQLEEFVSF